MLTLDEALARLLAAVEPLPKTEAQEVSTFDALGRVLAEPVRSALDVPPADNTSMDGYALRCADVPAAGTVLPVKQRIAAGQVGKPLEPGSAARIFTGAQIPAGADAVIMQEQCEALDGSEGPPPASTRSAPWATKGPYTGPGGQVVLGSGPANDLRVRINSVPVSGQWIRRRGEDVRAGAEVLSAGDRLTPQSLGLAASVGAARLQVMRRPRVALFSTGDELVMPGEVAPERMPPGAIYNSNRYTLRGLLQALGCEVTDLGIVPDRLDATRAALRNAAAGRDLIVTSGGVSVGEEDHLRPAVLAEGHLDLWQIAIKPGRPFAFGAVRSERAQATLFVGLPGNPVSSFVTFVLVVRPLLLRLQGVADLAPRGVTLRADFDWPSPDRRREFLRARCNADGGLDVHPNQSSGVLTSAVWADGLIDNPSAHAIARGDAVRFLPFAELLN